MRLILISDSHGNNQGIDKIFNSIEFDYLFFAGDGLSDIGNYIYLDNVYAVSGNCDFFSRIQTDCLVKIMDKKIFLTHGHKYNAKLGLSKLIQKAKEINADIVFYGHTHEKKIELIDGIYFINPGKFGKNSSGLIVEIGETEVDVQDLKL